MDGWLLAVLAIVIAVALCAGMLGLLAGRRRWLAREGGTFECSVRLADHDPGCGLGARGRAVQPGSARVVPLLLLLGPAAARSAAVRSAWSRPATPTRSRPWRSTPASGWSRWRSAGVIASSLRSRHGRGLPDRPVELARGGSAGSAPAERDRPGAQSFSRAGRGRNGSDCMRASISCCADSGEYSPVALSYRNCQVTVFSNCSTWTAKGRPRRSRRRTDLRPNTVVGGRRRSARAHRGRPALGRPPRRCPRRRSARRSPVRTPAPPRRHRRSAW